MRYQRDRLITGCRSEGLLGLHPELIGLSVQVLYPPHGFCIRNLSKINLSRHGIQTAMGVIISKPQQDDGKNGECYAKNS